MTTGGHSQERKSPSFRPNYVLYHPLPPYNTNAQIMLSLRFKLFKVTKLKRPTREQMLNKSSKFTAQKTQIMGNFRMLLIWFFLLSSTMRTSTSKDSLGMGQSIRDGETLVSAGGSFELGFFSPGTSTRRYLGMWYRDASGNSTVVWVANRESPLRNMSGVLEFNEKGILHLLNDTDSNVWSSNISGKASNNSIAQLLDSGNLVVKDGQNTANIYWQSFDYPTDTLMPEMKLGLNLVTGLQRILSCWKSAEDPAVGEYSLKIDPRGYPQLVQMKGSVINTRGGPWNGLYFTAYPSQNQDIYFRRGFVMNDKEVYYEFETLDKSYFSIYRTNPSSNGQVLTWTSQTRNLVENTQVKGQDWCEIYAFCGSNSICNMNGNIATCECLKGYIPKFPQQWNMSYWSNGCIRKSALDCNNTYGFLSYTEVKLPDTSSSWYNKTMNLDECQKLCLKNCSCIAYANLDIRNGGSGCLLWFDHLIDMRKFFKGGQDLYIKVPASELDHIAVNGHGKMKKKLGIAVGVIIFGLSICVIIMIIKNPGAARTICKTKCIPEDNDLPTFDFSILAKATENFSTNNKLGEGGFGSVYKGTLTDGQVVAVKRLSKKSGQGLEELKNEVLLIAKLQHRNLVKLLGC